MTEGRLAGFDGATGWLNSESLSREQLHGKVVLVDFCTYTCINWLRTLGYVRAWTERYEGLGLVVVGVHTPEFPFEADPDNVVRALADLNVRYPVALDPDFAIWNAFGNRYWPALYLADAAGRIQHRQFGEGAYDETERMIQRLLREAGASGVPGDVLDLDPQGVEAQADWERVRSGETYVGAAQGSNFAAAGEAVFDATANYLAPDELMLNTWALDGRWRIEDRAATLDEAGGGILFRFHARDVNLVLRSGTGEAITFRALLDGAEPGAARGLDVDEAGRGTLTEPRMYQLIRQPGTIRDRTIEIRFDEPGAEAYVFTFG